MDWFYAKNGQQLGPVSESYLSRLASGGEVTADTLVWHSGMAQWEPLRSAATAFETPLRPCGVCGRTLPSTDLAVFGGAAVCLACQPAYVQRLAQGMTSSATTVAGVPALRYGGFWIRVAASIIDNIILQIAQYAILLVLGISRVNTIAPSERAGSAIAAFLIVLVLHCGYYVFFWISDGAAIGYKIVGLEIVRPDGSPISADQAFGRYFAYGLNIFTLGIGLMMAGWDDEKRTLHDRICGTRVIKTR
jgi:uncharacterized RDD family membrane protein YckC